MRIESKIIYLGGDFGIIDGNREYYIYFERIGHRFSQIDEIVIPEQKQRFLEFLRAADGRPEIFRFKKYTEEFRLNLARAGADVRDGRQVLKVTLVDIEDALEMIERSDEEEERMRVALSLMDDTFFLYEKKSGAFRMLHYHGGKAGTNFDTDIDSWRKQVLEEGLVPERSLGEFEKFFSGVKACNLKIFSSFDASFRTNGKIVENLSFIGTRLERNGEVSVVGKVTPNARAGAVQATSDLLEELQVDALTKCYNKKTITNFAQKKFSAASSERTALIIVDLDHFKPVNDAYGHLAGDRVLSDAGVLLRNIVGEGGVVGRYGGDEFLIVMNSVTDETVLRGILQTILVNVSTKFESAFDDIKVTSSIGAAVFPDDGGTFDELFKKADFCLYRAKDKGRNRYVFYRKDLHESLYKKSVESTTGVKYQGRDVLELRFMSQFMQDLSATPYRAIRDILSHMCETYNLNDVTIYYGEEMRRVYNAGNRRAEQSDAKFVDLPGFSKMLAGSRFIRIDFPEDIRSDCQDLRDVFAERGIKSTILCILGSPDEITGLVSFNRTKESAQWAEYEVNCAVMFASCFNLLPESTKVDFALYNRLR